MSIEKYLEDVHVPSGQPGPFTFKLKHDIKKRLLLRKRRQMTLYRVAKYANVLLFLAVAFMIVNPDYAVQINRTFTGNPEPQEQTMHAEQQDDKLPLTEEGTYLGSGSGLGSGSISSRIVPVSTGGQASASSSFQIMELSELEENKPYIIRKFRDNNNRSVYLVNEMIPPESRIRRAY